MTTLREPAVAGMFYPAERQALTSTVDALLKQAKNQAKNSAAETCPKVIIAPHAGYVYSGEVAAKAYTLLEKCRQKISRVVLLGPSHRVGFKGIAASTAEKFVTPLGEIPLDVNTIKILTGLDEVTFLDRAHEQEHSLEVHLPFLQRVLDHFELIPLVVGDAGKQAVANLLEFLWGGEETLIVISSDLSHYHSYAEAQKLDSATSEKIVGLQNTLKGEEACGCRPLNGLLTLAAKKGMQVEQIAQNNSGDTAGSKDRVVGYGAYVIHEKEDSVQEEDYSLAQRQTMLQVARDAIQQTFLGNKNIELNLKLFPPALLKKKGTFVTLNINGELRGCIGSLSAQRPLIIDIIHNAQSAAFRDPRFPALTVEEFQRVDIHISILTEARPLDVTSREELLEKIRPGVDGLIIREQGRSATYLPSVWEKIPDPLTFIRELRRKAGLDPDGWDAGTQVFHYRTIEFS